MSEERLQKLLARAGVASRRHVEELIREGRVTVNGAPAGLGDKADPERDAVKVDGRRIDLRKRAEVYLVLNKPKAVMSTVSDPQGRRTVMELVPAGLRKGLVPVGRLDFMTEGLLLMTTDGEFAQKVSHPRHGCAKVYEVKVSGRPEESQLDRLRGGIVLEGKRTAPCRIEEHRAAGPRSAEENSWWRVELYQGRTRQIREMFSRIGNSVLRLRRVGVGSLIDPDLPLGAVRELTPEEVEKLRTDPTPPRPKRRPRVEREGTRRPAPEKAGTSVRSPRKAGPEKAGTSVRGPRKAAPEKAGTSARSPRKAGPEKAGTSVRGPRKAASEKAGTSVRSPRKAGPEKAGTSVRGPRKASPEKAGTSVRGPRKATSPRASARPPAAGGPRRSGPRPSGGKPGTPRPAGRSGASRPGGRRRP
ncbi:MAG TPA: pseudouridine synthase [Thermoanaerobaculia bacterium]|nr:pseudouridine synthase [Thermoanaerobaculia bacterium]